MVAASVTLPGILTVYDAPGVKSALGFRVATVLVGEFMLTVAGTGEPPLVGTSVKVEVVKVDGFIASPNVTIMLAAALTPVAPLGGFVDTTGVTGGHGHSDVGSGGVGGGGVTGGHGHSDVGSGGVGGGGGVDCESI